MISSEPCSSACLHPGWPALFRSSFWSCRQGCFQPRHSWVNLSCIYFVLLWPFLCPLFSLWVTNMGSQVLVPGYYSYPTCLLNLFLHTRDLTVLPMTSAQRCFFCLELLLMLCRSTLLFVSSFMVLHTVYHWYYLVFRYILREYRNSKSTSLSIQLF